MKTEGDNVGRKLPEVKTKNEKHLFTSTQYSEGHSSRFSPPSSSPSYSAYFNLHTQQQPCATGSMRSDVKKREKKPGSQAEQEPRAFLFLIQPSRWGGLSVSLRLSSLLFAGGLTHSCSCCCTSLLFLQTSALSGRWLLFFKSSSPPPSFHDVSVSTRVSALIGS